MSRESRLLLTLWLVVSFGFNYPALNADISNWRVRYADSDRSNASLAMFLGMLPVAGTIYAVFGTGFCQHGFKWRITP